MLTHGPHFNDPDTARFRHCFLGLGCPTHSLLRTFGTVSSCSVDALQTTDDCTETIFLAAVAPTTLEPWLSHRSGLTYLVVTLACLVFVVAPQKSLLGPHVRPISLPLAFCRPVRPGGEAYGQCQNLGKKVHKRLNKVLPLTSATHCHSAVYLLVSCPPSLACSPPYRVILCHLCPFSHSFLTLLALILRCSTTVNRYDTLTRRRHHPADIVILSKMAAVNAL